MSKVYAVCGIDGLIRFTPEPVATGQFALAVGKLVVIREVISATAERTQVAGHAVAWRVPGASEGADSRANLSAIAQYIQDLGTRPLQSGFRPLGV
ncbi:MULTISPECIES: hypothetical protein [unclassified Pseudomonas]|uniref:hypothetical protein n=1 Tax=unclassified Pseudomonas TaxID=196821 RepID=UPI000DA8391D|nr:MULTISPECIES: hypothetical protein [unclassified Pseudomonas]MDW3715324.1 hypothetical protein [Pseudomonas sp. 2023EL-01195]PZE10544.1 hypothetical protein DMX10_25525 [Pseudomonas sp. 57B-090624]